MLGSFLAKFHKKRGRHLMENSTAIEAIMRSFYFFCIAVVILSGGFSFYYKEKIRNIIGDNYFKHGFSWWFWPIIKPKFNIESEEIDLYVKKRMLCEKLTLVAVIVMITVSIVKSWHVDKHSNVAGKKPSYVDKSQERSPDQGVTIHICDLTKDC
jgi:hypothetical protein